MSRLESAAEVIEVIKSGKYANEVNAKRGVGRTRLSGAEKTKVFKFIDEYFQEGGSKPSAGQGLRPGKRVAKVAKKKKVGKKVTRRAAPEPEDYEEETTEETPDESTDEAPAPRSSTKKKVTVVREKGTLGISPSDVKTVADLLQVVDSTVSRSVRVIEALKQAHEVSPTGDIGEGIRHVKQALEGAAMVLHNQVVVPLLSSHQGADPSVQSRLEAVVSASTAGVAPEQSPLGVIG